MPARTGRRSRIRRGDSVHAEYPRKKRRSASQGIILPAWIKLTRAYLGGDVRSGLRANSSILRWRKRAFPSAKRSPS